MSWIRGRNWVFFQLITGGLGRSVTPVPGEIVILGPAINVQTAPAQIPFATLTAPVPGQHFILRRAGVAKSAAYAWTAAPHVSLGTVAPWTNIMINSNLATAVQQGSGETEPDLATYPSGTVLYVSVNTAGNNATANARVYPFVIGHWKTISIC